MSNEKENDVASTKKGTRKARTVAGESTEEVNHPAHYTNHPSGVECIQIVEHMSFNLGNAIKYVWRAGEKGPPETDLKKAIWYIQREIKRLARS